MDFAGLEIVDLRRPGERWGPMGEVLGIAAHHSVTDDDIRADNDAAAVEAIERYHTEMLGWPGIGYHFAIGDDGTIFYIGDVAQARAHVWGRNDELVGFVLLGTYMHWAKVIEPPQAQIEGAARLILALRRHYGRELAWKGHSEWALPQSPTACPGDTWPAWRGRIARAIHDIREAEMSEQEKLELKLRRGAALLQKKLADLDFQGVANALAWLGVRPR